MSTPKHRTAPGTSYFVTTKCWQGRAVFQVVENAEIVIEALFHYRDSGAYLLHEFVVMRDHLHLLLTPSATTSLEKAMQLIKGGSSYQIGKARQQKLQVWQVGFHEWTMRDLNDWQSKVQYIHENPVRAKLVQKPQDWSFSSATGKFSLDLIPNKFLQFSSGAKPQPPHPLTQGLKPLPPKEEANLTGAPSQTKVARA
jgi:putative transposase